MAVNVFSTGATNENYSRTELVDWTNTLCATHFTKIEEMCSGVAYCQILDMLFENCVPTKKVKFLAKNEVDYLSNWKVLQNGLKKVGIDKTIPVEKLTKGRFQDNLEFCQWFRKFFEKNHGGDVEYDALAVRGGIQLPINSKPVKPMSKPVRKPVSTKPIVSKAAQNSTAVKNTPVKLSSRKAEIDLLETELCTLKATAEGMENERDFYFRKLRDIETLCQEGQEDAPKLAEKITNILCQDDQEF